MATPLALNSPWPRRKSVMEQSMRQKKTRAQETGDSGPSPRALARPLHGAPVDAGEVGYAGRSSIKIERC